MMPATRRNFVTINIGCVLTIVGVWVEKGIGLILPGLTPGLLGEIYEYTPALMEVMIALGILATGALIFTVFTRVAGPLLLSDPEES
jgi:molybdopterin-containing oxidoreductase family membrane subunit